MDPSSIKVLVVEDSPVVREFLVHVLRSDAAIEVIGVAGDGEDAVRAAGELRPDLITMDIHMPKLDGLEATRQIMQTAPVPIVIVSGSANGGEVAATFRAVEAGAVSFVARPRGIGHPEHAATAKELIQTVKAMAEVKVVRRWPRGRAAGHGRREPAVAARPVRVAAIGASTGGPLALQSILAGIPAGSPLSILIVQHMAPGFIEGFVNWLAPASALRLQLAAPGAPLLPGCAYVAPDGCHLQLDPGNRLSLIHGEPENGHRPSVCSLFRSVAEACGPQAAGVLLTGMGRDGAAGLKRMREKGAITIAQNRESSIVYGMPAEAVRLDAAEYVLPPERIAAALATLASEGVVHERF